MNSKFLQSGGIITLAAIITLSVQGIYSSYVADKADHPTEVAATQGDQPYIGEITMFGGNYAPRGWALCDGQLLPISQNSALFSILGTTYGGDGRSTFGLPDLRGRVPMHAGNGPGLTPRQLGQKYGTEENILSQAQLPAHSHSVDLTIKCNADSGYTGSPVGKYPAVAPNTNYAPTTDANMANSIITGNTSVQGSGQPVNNMQPYQTVNFIIALQGIYPSRQ